MWKSRDARPLSVLDAMLWVPGWGRCVVVTVVGSALHAAGHTGLAAGAGLLSQALLASGSSGADATRVNEHFVLELAGVGVVAALAKMGGGALASWGEATIAGRVAAWLRLEVLDRLLRPEARSGSSTDNFVHTERQPDHTRGAQDGERLAALTTHIMEVERAVVQGVFGEVRAVLQLVPLAVLLAFLAPGLAGSGIAALGAFLLLSFGLRRTFKRAHARAIRSAEDLTVAADEAVRHAELWRSYGATGRIRSHVARLGSVIATEAARLRVRTSLLSSTSEVLGALALLGLLLLTTSGAVRLQPAAVIPFSIAFFMAYRPLRDLVEARLARTRGEAALKAALGSSRVKDRAVETSAGTATGSERWPLAPLVLEDVATHRGQDVRPLSLTIPPGSLVVLTGATGAGKTSLLRALLGLDPLRSGSIVYGGRPIDRAGVGPSARPFAWVPQDAPILADTLEANVRLAAEADARSPEELLRALGAASFTETLDAASVLVRDRPLSGGERRWVALARALASGLPVLLLDEPTSAHDPEAQARTLAALDRLRGRRTILLVTHRPEPALFADLVVDLDSGAIRLVTRDATAFRHAPSPGGPSITHPTRDGGDASRAGRRPAPFGVVGAEPQDASTSPPSGRIVQGRPRQGNVGPAVISSESA